MAKVYLINKNLFDKSQINYSNMNKIRMDYLEKLSAESKINSFLAWKLLKYVSYKEYDLDIDQLVLNYNEYGKPFFEEFEFSISHSDQYIAVGISKSKIGVDVQKINSNIDVIKFASKINCSEELIAVYKRFSSLEAYYKKIGCGLKPSLLKNKVEIQHQEIIDGKYMFTICSDEAIEKIIKR